MVDTNTRATFVHRQPADGQWNAINEVRANEMLRLDAIPTFAIRLDQFN